MLDVKVHKNLSVLLTGSLLTLIKKSYLVGRESIPYNHFSILHQEIRNQQYYVMFSKSTCYKN